MTKSELAHLYMPGKTSHSATNTLCQWIDHCPQLLQRLLATGYRKAQRHFTPMQTQLIYEYLGEP